MQLALRSRSLVATMLVIVVLAAALAILCPDGIHLPVSGGMESTCVVMTHSSVLGAAASSGSSPLPLSVMLAVVIGLTPALALARPSLAANRGRALLGRPVDPLNGRLRI